MIPIKNHKVSLPFDPILPLQEIIQSMRKAIYLKIFNAFLFILAETKEKLLKYPKIPKSLSKLWPIHILEKYTNIHKENKYLIIDDQLHKSDINIKLNRVVIRNNYLSVMYN